MPPKHVFQASPGLWLFQPVKTRLAGCVELQRCSFQIRVMLVIFGASRNKLGRSPPRNQTRQPGAGSSEIS